MSDATTNLLLPYLLASQAQKHVTLNESLRLLDGLVHLSVRGTERTEPPSDPADGDRFLVASGASGEWSGWDGSIAYWVDGVWLRLAPRPGWRVWIEEFDGSANGPGDHFFTSLKIRRRVMVRGYKQFGELFVPELRNPKARIVWETVCTRD